ncbi:hypothetical protein C3E98_038365, partial [Pseudomonas sp. MWU13-2625]
SYRPFAGGEVLDFGGGNLYALCTTRERRRTARHLSQLARYHCWIEARHDIGGRARKEIVDFTLRHDETVASNLGMPFARARHAYFWGWDDEHTVPAELRAHPVFATQSPVSRWAERQCMSLLRAYERERPGFFRRQVLRQLDLFAARVAGFG